MAPIDLSIFPKEREEKLKNIKRYSYFDVMMYRTDLWMHTHRVSWLVEDIASIAQKYILFDLEKARALALVHDDAEMITGDVQAITKLFMNKSEKEAMENNEFSAIDTLAEKYPKEIDGYSYRDLLIHAVKKDCIEAQFVSYCDKVDAFCESLHEIYAGNNAFLRSIVFYALTMPTFSQKFPDLAPLVQSKESPFTYITDRIQPHNRPSADYEKLQHPHTEESIKTTLDFPFYKRWKEINIEHGHLDWLITQTEFLK